MTTLTIPQSLKLTPIISRLAADAPVTIVAPGIKLGQATNLLLGFRAGWAPGDPATLPFFAADSTPLPTADVTVATATGASWGFPRITLHADANSLLTRLFPYDVKPLSGDAGAFAVPSGPLMIGDLDRTAVLGQLRDYLGIALTGDDAYMLVDMVRPVATVARQYVGGNGGDSAAQLTPAALATLSALSGVGAPADPARPLDAGGAAPYLQSFQSIGTHYVSQVATGDRIFQVFAYQGAAFAELSAAFKRSAGGATELTGINAISFTYYTTPRNTNTGVALGYTSQQGKLRIVSGNPKFAASVAAGAWLDPERAGGDSIFAAHHTGSAVDLSGFQDIVPIGIELTPIGNLIPVTACADGRRSWDRLLKGALLQKYGQAIRVTFPAEKPYAWQRLMPNAGAYLSTIATPTVNAFSGHVDLGAIALTNRAAVKSFSASSVVLEASGAAPAQIPGDKVSLSSYLIDTSGAGPAPTVELASQAAFDNLALACGKMVGALRIAVSGAGACKTVVDGVILKSGSAGSSGRAMVATAGDLFGVQLAERLLPQASNLNFTIVTCQALLNARGATAADSHQLARDCMVWLSDIIPDADDIPAELATIRLRATYLAHVAGNLALEGTQVPYLKYRNYKDYIAAMSVAAGTLNRNIADYQMQLAIQRNAELSAQTAQQINDNIKKTGQLLTGYIGAVAANQGDIAASYQSIIDTKQTELRQAVANFSDLAKAVSDQRDVVDDKKLAFQQAMVSYETTEIIKAVINISTAFVTVGIGIATPASTIGALKDLGETAQQIQKLVTVLNAIMKLETTIEDTVKNINSVTRTMDALRQVKLSMPNALQWSEMGIQFDASLAAAPSAVAGPKAEFSAAFKILVLRAQAMLGAQAKIGQLNAEIAMNKAQKRINDAQQQRLTKLTVGLNLGDTSKAPDLSEVDLLGLTGQLQSQLNQALANLAQALALQDSAVQFELLATPTAIQQFDLPSLQIVMASQQANILAAKEAFNPPPFTVHDPIQVTIKGVPVSAITGGNSFEFVLQPSVTEFQSYNMVRVQQVLVDIPAIRATTGGHYRIDLGYDGNPFEDRSQSGAPLTFNTVTRNFGPYEYQAADHKAVFGGQTGIIGDEISNITPFSTWRVKLPKLAINDGVDFGGAPAVDIVLSFRIEALAEKARYNLLAAAAPDGFLRGSVADAAPAPAAKALLADMLSQMYEAQAALKGWDCVLNMLEGPVNQFLAAQYNAKYSKEAPMKVSVGFCQAFGVGGQTVLGYTRFSVLLGQPLLAFQANNSNYVAVTQAIQSGQIETGSKMVSSKGASCPVPLNLDDPTIQWEAPQPIDVSTKPTLEGTVALGMVQGLVTPILPSGKAGDPADAHSVILDFAKGSFVAKNLNIDTDNASLNLQLSNWFVTNPIAYTINTVVFNDATTLKSLQPTKFKLNVLSTNSGKNVLQVFITTTGLQQNNLTINVNEPIPDGFHNSLMINTKIMFQDIFVDSFNKHGTNLQVQTVNPGKDYTAWSAVCSSGSVSGEATFNNTSNSETRISASGNTVTWPLDGLAFSRTKDLGVALTYNAKKTVNFEHRDYTCVYTQYGSNCSWSSWNGHSVDVDITLTGNYNLTVSDTDGKQSVQIASTPPNVTVTPPDLNPTGPCECNDNDLKIMVGNLLKKQVPLKLQDAMAGISFTSVSVFALYNLLFPTDDFIVMKEAYVPGDLVVLGTFNKYVDEPAQ